MTSQFIKDLKRGAKGEALVYEIFRQHGYNCQKSNRSKFFDLIVSLRDFSAKIEVKTDYKAKYTGNIAIEFRNNKLNQVSGIDVTKSDFIIYVVDERVYIAATSDLLEYISYYKPKATKYNVGDDNSSILLYDKDTILNDVFKDITCVSTTEIDETIGFL